MQGMLGFLENSTGLYFTETSDAFEKIGAHETHLFTCEMSLPLSRERGTAVLLVNRYNDKAELKDSGTWLEDPQGRWRRLTTT